MYRLVSPSLPRMLLSLTILAGCADPVGPEPSAAPANAASSPTPDLTALRIDKEATAAVALSDVVVYRGLVDASARRFVERNVSPDHPIHTGLRTRSAPGDAAGVTPYDLYVPGPIRDRPTDPQPCSIHDCDDDGEDWSDDGDPSRGGAGGRSGNPDRPGDTPPRHPSDPIDTDSGSGVAMNLAIGLRKYITFASWTRSASKMYKVVLDITMEVNGVERMQTTRTKTGGVTIFNGFNEFAYGQTISHWGSERTWTWICNHIVTPTGSTSPQLTDYSQADITI